MIPIAHAEVRVEVVNLHDDEDDDVESGDINGGGDDFERVDDGEDIIMKVMSTSIPVPLCVNLAHSTVRNPHSS